MTNQLRRNIPQGQHIYELIDAREKIKFEFTADKNRPVVSPGPGAPGEKLLRAINSAGSHAPVSGPAEPSAIVRGGIKSGGRAE